LKTSRKRKPHRLLHAILSVLLLGGALAFQPAQAKATGGVQTSAYVDGVASSLPSETPEGEVSYSGIIGPNIALEKVYASITARNATYSDIAGTMTLQTLDAGNNVTRTTSKEVVFTARSNDDRSLFDVRHGIESAYTPGESFLLTFTVGGVEVARFEHGASVERNIPGQAFAASDAGAYLSNMQKAVTPSHPTWAWPQTYGEAAIARWDGNRIGALSITIDDNLIKDHPTWRRLASYYDIPLTWVVVGGDNFTHGEYESWRALQEIGMGFQSHTYTHYANITTSQVTPERTQLIQEEYSKSSHALSKLTGGIVPTVIAFPGGNPNGPSAADTAMAWDYFVAERSYSSPINSLSAGDSTAPSAYQDTIKTLFDYSVRRFNVSGYGGYGSIYFHAVGSGADTATAASVLRLAHENRDRLWTGLNADIRSYIYERETSTLTTVSATPEEIQLQLTDQLHDDTYNYPLTLKLKIGESWEGVKVEQAGNVSYGSIEIVNGVKQALIRAIPDRGPITVTPVNASEAATGTPEQAALSEASLHSLSFRSEDSVSRPVPGFSSNHEGGEYTLFVPYGTDSVTITPRAGYVGATLSLSQPDGVLDLQSGDRSLTIAVTSANGASVNEYVVHVRKAHNAAPLVSGVLFEDRFDHILNFTTSSNDPLRWNGLTSALTGNALPRVDPENRKNNTIAKLQAAGNTTHLYKNHIVPANGELGFSSRIYIPGNTVGNGSFRLMIAGADIVRFMWDASAGHYKWYIGGSSEANGGVYGGIVYPDRWLNLSVYIKASESGETLSQRWGDSSVQVRISQADDTTGEVVSAVATKSGVPCTAINNTTGVLAITIGLINASAGAALYLDDVLIYQPVTPTVEETPATNARLASLTYRIGNGPVKNVSGFWPEDYAGAYTVTLPHNATSVTVGAATVESGASVAVTPTGGIVDVSSGSGSATVTVTSEDSSVVHTYTVQFTVSPSLAPDPLYSKIFKYHFDYSWVTPGSALTTSSQSAGSDGATHTQPDGRWAGKGGNIQEAVWDPDNSANKTFRFSHVSNYLEGFIVKNKLKPNRNFVISGRIRLDDASSGNVEVQFAGKRLLQFQYDASADNYTWSVGSTPSGGRVEKDTWLTYDLHIQPDGTDWSNAILTGYVTGSLEDVSGQPTVQLKTVQTGFNAGHDGLSERSYKVLVPKTQHALVYVDDAHLYQPGLMSAHPLSSVAGIAPNGQLTVRMLSGDNPVGTDIAPNIRMGQHLDLATLTSAAVQIVSADGGASVTPELLAHPDAPDTFTLSFAGSPLTPGKRYYVIIGDSLKDTAGQSVDPGRNRIAFTVS
jgi:peptidoglycan/xylan/chitin deacetylase (PgdA/CDA1 family)